VGALVVYDVTKYETFQHVANWLKELKANADPKIVIMIVGNKSDLEDEREVRKEEAEAYAKMHDLAFLETSALDSSNVSESFEQIIIEIHRLINTFQLPEQQKEQK
jgi:small GTP-binding protein